jgi:hypothetical protein
MRIFSVSLASLVVLGLIQKLGADDPNGKSHMSDNEKASAPEQSASRIIVSNETTHVLGPLREDGSVDFLAAINERSSKGVTPGNNAAIAYWRLIGPTSVPEPNRESFFRNMGIPALPSNGKYFLGMDEFYRRRLGVGKIQEEHQAQVTRDLSDPSDSAASRPWAATEFPVLGEWMERNTAELDHFVADSRKTRFYSPLYYNGPVDRSMSMFIGNSRMESRGIAYALRLRASLRLKTKNVDDALNDCLAAHRLARHIGQGPYMVDALVAIAVEGVACAADRVVAEYGALSASQANRFRSELDQMPAMPRLVDIYSVGERLFALNSICCLARQDSKYRREWAKATVGYSGLFVDDEDIKKQVQEQEAILSAAITNDAIDWNEALRLANRWTDRIVDACKPTNYRGRRLALGKLQAEFQRMGRELWNSTDSGARTKDPTSWAANALIFECMNAHAISALDEVSATRVDLAKLSISLAAYRTEQGTFPARLRDLALKYAADVPRDRFTDGELHYKLVDEGYLLYSVGPNEKDDEGRAIYDKPEGDDISVRMPQKCDANRCLRHSPITAAARSAW